MITWGWQDEADTGPHSSDVSESVVRVLRPRSGERGRLDAGVGDDLRELTAGDGRSESDDPRRFGGGALERSIHFGGRALGGPGAPMVGQTSILEAPSK